MENLHTPSNAIKYWAEDDRPREKLLAKSPASLSNSELLAILINNGTRNRSALDLAKDILKLGKDNLNELGRLTVKDLQKVPGIGPAKAVTIAAALELGRRRQAAESLVKPAVSSSSAVADYLRSILQDENREVFVVIFLNRANRINSHHVISTGGITGTVADPRIIMKKALEENATSIILSHNHPSGNINPSREDIMLTKKIKEAASFLDISVLDHIIIGNDKYYSFADSGDL